jgi:predicted  nucleic acid-binding Zn-ribbon protein
MQKIEPGTVRWAEILEVARGLRARGALTVRRLREEASCSGEVAGRILVTVHQETGSPTGGEASSENMMPTAAADTFDGPVEGQWMELVARLKRLAVQACSDYAAQVATSRDAEIRRLLQSLQELQEERGHLLDVLKAAHEEAAAARKLADDERAAHARCAREADEARGRGARAEEDVQQLRTQLEREASSRAQAKEALTKASADLTSAAARADQAEAETRRLGSELMNEKTEAARLRGELEATRRAMADLRAIIDSQRGGALRRVSGRKPGVSNKN